MKISRDGTHFRNADIGTLCEALITALDHERFQVPPVPLLYDLDTSAMLCGMSRKHLRDYLRRHPNGTSYTVNNLTRQEFLKGDDIKRIHSELTHEQPCDQYNKQAINLPCVQKRLAKTGAETGGDHS